MALKKVFVSYYIGARNSESDHLGPFGSKT